MSNIKQTSYTLNAPAVGGIAASQGVAVTFIINGSQASNSKWVANSQTMNKVALTSPDNNSAANITITGKLLSNGATYSEILTGLNANTVESVQYYAEVTSITTDAAITNTSVDVVAKATTNPLIPDSKEPSLTVSVQIVSGTVTVSLQHTLTNTLATIYDTEANTAFLDNDAPVPLTGLTSGQTAAAYTAFIAALRLKVTTYTGTPSLILRTVQAAI